MISRLPPTWKTSCETCSCIAYQMSANCFLWAEVNRVNRNIVCFFLICSEYLQTQSEQDKQVNKEMHILIHFIPQRENAQWLQWIPSLKSTLHAHFQINSYGKWILCCPLSIWVLDPLNLSFTAKNSSISEWCGIVLHFNLQHLEIPESGCVL